MTEPSYTGVAYLSGQGDTVWRHRSNPRRAYDRDGREIAPMDLANAMKDGVRAIRAICQPPCRHEGELPINCSPTTMTVRNIELRLRCLDYGRRGPETEPVWPRRSDALKPAPD